MRESWKSSEIELRNLLECIGQFLLNSWENSGNVLRRTFWESLKKSWESPEKVLGKSWESPEKVHRKSWNCPEKVLKKFRKVTKSYKKKKKKSDKAFGQSLESPEEVFRMLSGLVWSGLTFVGLGGQVESGEPLRTNDHSNDKYIYIYIYIHNNSKTEPSHKYVFSILIFALFHSQPSKIPKMHLRDLKGLLC